MSHLAALVLSLLPLPQEADESLQRLRVAFSSYRDGEGDVFVMTGDGSYPRRLTPCSDEDKPAGWIKAVGPAWSPDGERIAFHVYRENAPRALCVMNVDGSERRVLIDDQDAVDAAWSPEGREIAFQSGGELWIVPADGGEPIQVTEIPQNVRKPSWSPDGSRIVFCAGGFVNGALLEEIHVIELATGTVKQLTELGGETSLPSWSPDGEWIAFNAGDDDSADLCVVRPDGSDLRFLARTGKLYGPSWSPDGMELYATGFFDENPDVYALSLDGKRLRRLSDHPGDDTWVSVRPVLADPRGVDPERVERELDVAELEARNAIDLLRQGNALLRKEQYGEAADAFRRVVERDPGFGRAWLRLALAQHRSGAVDQAVGSYEKAATYRRNARTAHYNLACLHSVAGREDAAFLSLRSAIESGYRDWNHIEQDPDLAPLREDERFAELGARIR